MKVRKEIYLNIMMIVVVSFFGFMFEDIFLAITHGFFDNRNMGLPFLLGYGVLVDIIYLINGTPKDIRFLKKRINIENKYLKKVIYLLFAALFVSVGEIMLGVIVEKTCHVIWWNYTYIPLHITKYTSIPTSFGFGLLITVLMDYIFIPIYNYYDNWDMKILEITSILIISLLLIDYTKSIYYIYKNNRLKPIWRIYVDGSKPNIMPIKVVK